MCIPFYLYHKIKVVNEPTNEIIILKEPILINDKYVNTIVKQTITTVRLCYAEFPNKNWVKRSTIYTVIVTYVIPLTIIILCYMKIIMRIIKKSNDNIWENQTNSKNFTSFHSKKQKNNYNGKEAQICNAIKDTEAKSSELIIKKNSFDQSYQVK